MTTREAFVILSSEGERSSSTVFSGLSFCKETAEKAAKGIGYMGSNGEIKRVLTATFSNNETVVLGEWGVIGCEETLKIRPITVLKNNASDSEIESYFTAFKTQDRLSKIITSLSDEDLSLLKTYLANGSF